MTRSGGFWNPMPIHKHEPVPREDMYRISPRYTICECLREIYELAVKLDNGECVNPKEIKLLCRTATAMAKSMERKLDAYKAEWDEEFWDGNPRFDKAIEKIRQEQCLNLTHS